MPSLQDSPSRMSKKSRLAIGDFQKELMTKETFEKYKEIDIYKAQVQFNQAK